MDQEEASGIDDAESVEIKRWYLDYMKYDWSETIKRELPFAEMEDGKMAVSIIEELTPEEMKTLVERVSVIALIIGLKEACKEFRDYVFSFTECGAKFCEEEFDKTGPLRLSTVETCQKVILRDAGIIKHQRTNPDFMLNDYRSLIFA